MATKSHSGIPGLDAITAGGLPQGRITVVTGEPGNGKSIFSLQFLSAGVREFGESGIFVAFEEPQQDVGQNARNFGWGPDEIVRIDETDTDVSGPRVAIFEANPTADLMQAGDFDLSGYLAILTSAARRLGAKRIVFDGLDVLLDLLEEPRSRRREILRLRDWVGETGLTALVTSKPLDTESCAVEGYGFLRYLASCLIVLRKVPCGRSLVRSLEVVKLRGSVHSTSHHPFVIADAGIAVGDVQLAGVDYDVSADHISAGIPRLDDMLGGGYHRGSSILVSGAPGTAKTTLCGSFAEAACDRNEAALFVSFDEPPAQIIRNLRSIGIDLERHVASGLLSLVGRRVGRLGPEEHIAQLMELVEASRPAVVVIDPISALSAVAQADLAGHMAERIIDTLKARGITVLMTSLLEGPSSNDETTRAQISSIADTWIHLSFAVQAGERNRALTIIKSRGNAHSNQVRELMLSPSGADLADVYTASGEVLMGSARLEKEREEAVEDEVAGLEFQVAEADIEHAEILARLRLEEASAQLTALQQRRRAMMEGEVARAAGRRGAMAERLRSRHGNVTRVRTADL